MNRLSGDPLLGALDVFSECNMIRAIVIRTAEHRMAAVLAAFTLQATHYNAYSNPGKQIS